MEKDGNRLLALEGIRGVASIIVTIYHSLLIFYIVMLNGPGDPSAPVQHMRLEDNVYGSPFGVFISGTFAVAVFFVLSGFVLSVGFFQTGDAMVVKKLAAKRYIRLMLPAFASVMIAWLLITLHLSSNAAAQTITRSGWLADMWSFTPHFFDALAQGLWGIFATGQNYYNPVLWTMLFEFVGSFIVFVTLLLFGSIKKRWLVYIVLIILTIQTWYVAFVFGMILADLYSSKIFPFKDLKKGVAGLFIVVGLLFGGYPAVSTVGSLYETLGVPGFPANRTLYLSLGAALVIAAIVGLPSLNRFFSRRRLTVLGKYTFSLYLTHKLVLFTVCTGLFVWLYQFMGYNAAALVSVLVSIPFIIIAAYLFERYVDAPSIRLSGVFANWLLGLPQREGITAYSEIRPPLFAGSVDRVKRLAGKVTGGRQRFGRKQRTDGV